MSNILKHIKSYIRTPKEEKVTYSDPRQLMRIPDWLIQTKADLDRHEGFREFAYPDPLSVLRKRYPREKWGFRPAVEILQKIGLSLSEAIALGTPWTVGYGFTRGVTPTTRVSKERAMQILEPEIIEHVAGLDVLIPTWRKMPVHVQTVLANLIYNMGHAGLAKFTNTLAVFKAGNYPEAGERLTKSLWYKQTGSRARELVERLKTGEIQERYKVI